MMADSFSYEGLQCPQYVNFASGFEETPTDTIGFGPTIKSPGIFKDVNTFKVPKPKPSTHVGSTIKKSSVCKVVQASNITDSMKLNTKKLLSKRFSKSDGALNIEPNVKLTAKKKLNYFGGHKRSLSENDLRMKKKILPTTPMCLKRTINNTKAKKLMTTEERELEIIAKLRRQTYQHLRANEITMRRQKMKQACNLQKESGISIMKEKKAPLKSLQHDNNPIVDKVKDCPKSYHSQSRKEVITKESSSLHAETLKKINNLKKTRTTTSNCFENFLNPMPSNGISVATFERESINSVMKSLSIKKADAHSGLAFSVAQKKVAIKPFNFQARACDSNSKLESGVKQKDTFNNILKTPQLIAKNKENMATLNVSHCSVKKSGKPLMEKKPEYRGFRY